MLRRVIGSTIHLQIATNPSTALEGSTDRITSDMLSKPQYRANFKKAKPN